MGAIVTGKVGMGGADHVAIAATPEDAAFIVQACNAHEELRSAAQAAYEFLRYANLGGKGTNSQGGAARNVKRLDKALALANKV